MARKTTTNAGGANIFERAPVQAVPNPILCKPYDEPTSHWVYKSGVPEQVPGRRPASYWFTTTKTGAGQAELFAEEERDDLPLVNALRKDVARWRESGYRGASPVTKDLLQHWASTDRARRLFFCQREAVETAIYLLEMRLPGRSNRTGFKNFDCPDEDIQRMLRGERPRFETLKESGQYPVLIDQPADASLLPLRRLGCKMATGSGKTVVMAMLVAWAFCNRGRNPASTEYPSGVLICCPNLTIKKRLQVLRPSDPDNYYAAFDIVPARYREYLNAGEVLVTNWHVFGRKSEHDEGGVSYRVVDKGEEDDRAFTLDRLKDLANRLPILVLNDEGHHCWRPRPHQEDEVEGTREEKAAAKEEIEEARVWLDGLDRINNSGLVGPKRPCVLATIDLSATPFFLGSSGHIEGSPFPWLISDFGLVDAIESGIVKIPRLPVLEEGGAGKKDEAGRPDPKFFALWRHITEGLKPSDRVGKRPKPEAVFREAQSALHTLVAQWEERFQHYEAAVASKTQQTIPPVMIVVCADTETAQRFYEAISGEREEEVPKASGKGNEMKTVYETSKYPALQNAPAVRRTIRIDSKLLAKIEADAGGSRDEKAEELRRIIDTVGKPGQPGEHVRCVVSVSMLTEGWDANNVTQILGVRAFQSQLLCEQVVGRGLRRRSYTPNPETGLLEPEYVDVYGIPFSLIPFKGRAKDEKAPEDKPKNHVRPLPSREHLEIRAPRVESYVYGLGQTNSIECDVAKLEGFEVREEPDAVYVRAVRGYDDTATPVDPTLGPDLIRQDRESYYSRVHEQAIHFEIARRVMDRLVAGQDQDHADRAKLKLEARHLLFPQILKLVQEYVVKRVTFAKRADKTEINHKEIGLEKYVSIVVQRLADGIVPAAASAEMPLRPVLNTMKKFHTTHDGEETTTRPVVPIEKSHLNGVAIRSGLEKLAAEALDRLDVVHCFTPNSRGFGLRIPYAFLDGEHVYEPDFIVRVRGESEKTPRFVLLEIKGGGGEIWDPNQISAKSQAAKKWCEAVNNVRKYGTWNFVMCKDIAELETQLEAFAAPAPAPATPLPFRHVTPTAAERWKTCVPLVTLKAAAGAFSETQDVQQTLFDAAEWVAFESTHRFEPGMFVAQVKGRSMEPLIPDGSYCLFRPYHGGTREAKVMLVQHHDIADPETGAAYTVKRYRSEKAVAPDTGEWRHVRIALVPENKDVNTIELTPRDDGEVACVAEFVALIA